MTNKKLLIVEDIDSIYMDMRKTLETKLTAYDTYVEVERASTLYEARLKVRSFRPLVVSTDMNFPKRDGELPVRAIGITIVEMVSAHYPAHCLIYSGEDPQYMRDCLGTTKIRTMPCIIPKKDSYGHQAWASAVLTLLNRHA